MSNELIHGKCMQMMEHFACIPNHLEAGDTSGTAEHFRDLMDLFKDVTNELVRLDLLGQEMFIPSTHAEIDMQVNLGHIDSDIGRVMHMALQLEELRAARGEAERN